MHTSLASAAVWAAVLRIGLGLWWLESFRHKNLTAWIKRQAGINWAADIASKHRWPTMCAPCERSATRRAQARWMTLNRVVTTGSPVRSSFHTVSVTTKVMVLPFDSFV